MIFSVRHPTSILLLRLPELHSDRLMRLIEPNDKLKHGSLICLSAPMVEVMHYQRRTFGAGHRAQVDSPASICRQTARPTRRGRWMRPSPVSFPTHWKTIRCRTRNVLLLPAMLWLNAQLHFDAARLTPRICKRYQQWHAALNPERFTLIFASAYLNSPSSMYGHTFLRIDAQDQNEQTRLLAYAVNFAANTNETNGLAFAVNGLFGGYQGAFSMLPYYTKVREYSDFESRDLWEYRLDLTHEEMDKVLLHAWELGPNYFDYFFFDETVPTICWACCRWHVQFDFTTRFRWGAIPADTVRELTSYPGLVNEVVYRPATVTTLRYRLAQMNEVDKASVRAISLGRITPDAPELQALPLARHAAVLEASLDYTDHRAETGKHDVAEPEKRVREIRLARSQLDIISAPVVPPEPNVKPDQGHASSRYILAAGRRGTQNFQELQLRATYHDLMDAEAGYIRGAQIDFFNMTVRHYDHTATRLERFTPVDILSLSPRDEFFQPWSWKVSGGWERVRVQQATNLWSGFWRAGWVVLGRVISHLATH